MRPPASSVVIPGRTLLSSHSSASQASPQNSRSPCRLGGALRSDAVSGPVTAVSSRPALQRRALITGIGGQDGSLLAEFLLSKGYRVAGIVRRPPSVYAANLAGILDKIELVDADLLDRDSLVRAFERTRPHEVYNLAAPSFVPRSWDEPVLT